MANPPPLKADENGFVSATDFEEWLVSWEVYAAKLMGDAAAKIAEKHLNMYVDTLVASGDASVFDPMTAEWQVAVDEFLDLGVKPMYLQGSIGAQLGAPMMPIDLLAEWTEVVNVNAKNYVATASNRIVGASQSIWSQVQFSAEQSISVGVEIPKLRQEVENITGYASGRAQAIARTETMGAYNGGDMDGARALGEYGPVEKSWLATPGSRTRASHKKANDQTVLMDESFIVGGKSMDRPLDPSGPADEVVNCRCVMQMFFVGDTRPDGTVIESVEAEAVGQSVSPDPVRSAKRDRYGLRDEPVILDNGVLSMTDEQRAANSAQRDDLVEELRFTFESALEDTPYIVEVSKGDVAINKPMRMRDADGKLGDVIPGGMRWEIEIYDLKGKKIGLMERSVKVLDDGVLSVEHKLFMLDKNVQGQGLAARLSEAADLMYAELGIEQVTLNANIDVGGYAWARAGYDWDGPRMREKGQSAPSFIQDVLELVDVLADPNSPRKFEFSEAVKKQARIDRQAIIDRTLDDGYMPTPYDLSRIGFVEGPDGLNKFGKAKWPGKDAMLGSNWYGKRTL